MQSNYAVDQWAGVQYLGTGHTFAQLPRLVLERILRSFDHDDHYHHYHYQLHYNYYNSHNHTFGWCCIIMSESAL